MNLSPSSGISFKTPYKMWTRQTPNYAYLKVFDCQAYAHVNQGKLAPRALKSVFIGYPNRVKWYKLWCTDLIPLRCIISRDVIFNEGEVADNFHKNKH